VFPFPKVHVSFLGTSQVGECITNKSDGTETTKTTTKTSSGSDGAACARQSASRYLTAA
jgi:hypothetical protein